MSKARIINGPIRSIFLFSLNFVETSVNLVFVKNCSSINIERNDMNFSCVYKPQPKRV